jgi:5-formyltetrahydrofolate cyclo-ligase
MVENAKKLKKQKLQLRDALSPEKQQQYSCCITEQVLKIDCFQKAATVFVYVDFRSEVQTRSLIQKMLILGKKVIVPVTLLQERDLLPIQITNMDNDLAPGYASILEPIEGIRRTNCVLPGSIDLIFLPGSVFDERGGRMGYGGGFYDRFVSQKAPQAHRIGLCYELQVVEEAPLQDHDERMDMIVTEKRIIKALR